MSTPRTARAKQRSCSSSLPRTENPATYRLCAYGVDTVRYAWRPDEEELERFRAAAPRRRFRLGAGASRWACHEVTGIQIGEFTSHGLLVAEGRLAAMLSGDPDDRGLAPVSTLAQGAVRAAAAIEEATGVALDPLAAALSRVDLASDVVFTDPAHGVLFLWSAAAVLTLPRLGTVSELDATRQITSVRWEGSSGVMGRLYDAGSLRNGDARGSRLRLEWELRFPRAKQRRCADVDPRELAERVLRRLHDLRCPGPELRIAGLEDVDQRLRELLKTGMISDAVRLRLLGAAFVYATGRASEDWSRDQQRELERRLRELGIAVSELQGLVAEPYDLAPVLAVLRRPWESLATVRPEGAAP
jgi:hypothetical protein